MFATFGNNKEGLHKGTQILVSDSPEGPFVVHSQKPVTPKAWECLDGTFYIEHGKPYMVFCHEWQQIGIGEICVIALSSDLTRGVTEPMTILKANENSWADKDTKEAKYVTDGPFLISYEKRLYMIWSSLAANQYVEAVSYSDSGLISKFVTKDKLLFSKDGGHGMIFETFEGQKLFTLHAPNTYLQERPIFIPVEVDKNGINLLEAENDY